MVPPLTAAWALRAKRPSPPAGSEPVAAPAQRVAQRGGIGRERAVDLERRLVADGAVERRLERTGIGAEFESRIVARERRRKIRDAEARVDGLVVPDEMAGGGEAFCDRRPGERQLDALQRFVDVAAGIADRHDAVIDADFRKRQHPLVAPGVRLQRPGQDVDQRRPVGAAVGFDRHGDARLGERDIGDFDAARRATASAADWRSAARPRRPVRPPPARRARHRKSSTVAAGNIDIDTGPRSTGSRPVTARISLLTASRTASTANDRASRPR